MALLFMDSFDHYVTADIPKKYASAGGSGSGSVVISPANGRRGSACMRINTIGYADTAVILAPGPAGGTGPTSGALLVFGCAIRLSTLPTSGYFSLVRVYDSATNNTQLSFLLGYDGLVKVVRSTGGGQLLAVTTASFPTGVYVSVEIKALIDPINGSVEMKWNGSFVVSVGGINTSQSGAPRWTGLGLGNTEGNGYAVSGGSNIDLDDLYVMDGSGTPPWNNFIGDCRVDARFPMGPGASSGWAPSAGANWQNVDDAAPNDDTDYNTGATANLTDTFVVQDAPVPGAAIYGVQHNLGVRKLDAGACGVGAVVRYGSPPVDYVSADIPISTAYTNARVVQQTCPATNAPWVEADFNASEFGYKKTL